ncbi:MAG: sporulation protein YabP [Clostridia bacterium]|nr:sporulation protein YabP [Clostridia bacterium]
MSSDTALIHNIIIENRKKGTLSGVKDVIGFDSESITLITDMGNLTIKGTDLKINRFSTEKGELDIEGLIVAFVYTHDAKSGTFFSKIFK